MKIKNRFYKNFSSSKISSESSADFSKVGCVHGRQHLRPQTRRYKDCFFMVCITITLVIIGLLIFLEL